MAVEPEFGLANTLTLGHWIASAFVIATAAGLLWGLDRLSIGLQWLRFRMWRPVVGIIVWGLAALLIVRVFAGDAVESRWLLLALAILLGVAAKDWLRDLFYCAVLTREGILELGQHLRVGTLEGRIVARGTRAVTLRASDGTQTQIPYSQLAREHVTRLNLESRDTPRELVVHLPPDVTPERVAKVARVIAAVTPFASPRQVPEVFVESAARGEGLLLRIRGYVFDREFTDHFASDVLLRLEEFVNGEREADDRRLRTSITSIVG